MNFGTIEMNQELYEYLMKMAGREPPVLAELRAETNKLVESEMQVSPMQGQFLGMLVRMTGAKRVLEVGVFTGYSSLSMALALPEDGTLLGLDVSEKYAATARRFWQKAGVDKKATLRVAPAAQSMDALMADGMAGKFDLIFIDADKENYPIYWDKGLPLLRPGGLIMADNVLFHGAVVPSFDSDEKFEKQFAYAPPVMRPHLKDAALGARKFNEYVKNDDRVYLAMIPVGDGMTLGVKK